jgi:hypothetical protein
MLWSMFENLGNGRPLKRGTDLVVELPVLPRPGKRSVLRQDPLAIEGK